MLGDTADMIGILLLFRMMNHNPKIGGAPPGQELVKMWSTVFLQTCKQKKGKRL